MIYFTNNFNLFNIKETSYDEPVSMLLITMRGAHLPLAFLGENNVCKDRYNYIAGIHSFQNLPYKIVSIGAKTCDLEHCAGGGGGEGVVISLDTTGSFDPGLNFLNIFPKTIFQLRKN